MRKPNRLPFLSACLLAAMLMAAGCAKDIVEEQKRLLMDIMTNGRWLVQSFSEAGVDLSSSYAPFEFQFRDDGTVEAIRGSEVVKGEWSVDAANTTIRSGFPQGLPELARLSENWQVMKTTLTSVEARPLNTARSAYLKLVKK